MGSTDLTKDVFTYFWYFSIVFMIHHSLHSPLISKARGRPKVPISWRAGCMNMQAVKFYSVGDGCQANPTSSGGEGVVADSRTTDFLRPTPWIGIVGYCSVQVNDKSEEISLFETRFWFQSILLDNGAHRNHTECLAAVCIYEPCLRSFAMVKKSGRWFMAAMATLLMVCLGTVYAWSYFQTPIMKAYGWNNTQVSLIFSFAILFLGVSAAFGGVWLPRIGPRKMAAAGSVLFGLGYALAGLALSIKSLPLLYIGYGVIGGTGLGLGYVTPVATIAKWFPDKKGLATGMVIMGFGFGSLVMSKILAPTLLNWTGGNLVAVFLALAVFFFVVTLAASLSFKNPPAGWSPAGIDKKAAKAPAQASKSPAEAFKEARSEIFSVRFLLVWIMFFCNITAGIAIVAFQSPLFQDLWHKTDPSLVPEVLAGFGATLIAVTSLFNGFGRFFWGAVSDKAGRIKTFRILLGSELVVFVALILSGSPWVFAVLLCWVLLCYGGGFGTMPATISELFGQGKMTVIYGVVLTAWAAGGVVGPQITAFLKDKVPEKASTLSLIVGACFVAAGFLVSLLIKPAAAPAAKPAAAKPAKPSRG
jgi:OFA family oxalate/formate antiporter-like MFS transporter